MIMGERLLKPTDRIYDLLDVVEQDAPGQMGGDQEIIAIDARVYENVARSEGRIYVLSDVLEEGSDPESRKEVVGEEIRKLVVEMAEKIAREIMPGVAERVIREEIEKLKNETGQQS